MKLYLENEIQTQLFEKRHFFVMHLKADANMKKKLRYFIYGCKKHRKFGELYQLPKFHAKLENMP